MKFPITSTSLIYFEFVECLCMNFLKNNLTSRQSNRKLNVQSCKLYDNKYMIISTQITNTETFVLVFKLLGHKVCLQTEQTIETVNK